MADTDVERRSRGMGWLWWAVGLLALILIVWWAWPAGEEAELALEDAQPTAEVQPQAAETVGEQPAMSLGEIIANPGTYTGQTWTSEVNVTEVPTDRGFWIEEDGERVLVVIVDQPREQPFDVQPNTTLRLEQAVVRDPGFLAELPGAPLDADTEALVRDQPVFLTVDESNIHRVGQDEQPQGGM